MPMNSNVLIVNFGVMVWQIATTNQMSKDGGYYDMTKIVSEYDHEIPQSQTTDKPMVPRGRATKQS